MSCDQNMFLHKIHLFIILCHNTLDNLALENVLIYVIAHIYKYLLTLK